MRFAGMLSCAVSIFHGASLLHAASCALTVEPHCIRMRSKGIRKSEVGVALDAANVSLTPATSPDIKESADSLHVSVAISAPTKVTGSKTFAFTL
ncbi:hypothetical protein GE061_003432 [Apolygus lucorum]|uniref:Secreted protein n=1 Tax=Apolygus lucorum TaxID=248454 RepID=A0A8S9X3J0_APOLU|nr:hypothetical protein GE061_003432 [Apolygus lucorum]